MTANTSKTSSLILNMSISMYINSLVQLVSIFLVTLNQIFYIVILHLWKPQSSSKFYSKIFFDTDLLD